MVVEGFILYILYLGDHLPYVQCHTTINVLSASLNLSPALFLPLLIEVVWVKNNLMDDLALQI